MRTISIQLLEPKALQLLEQLEDLRLLKMLEDKAEEVPLSKRLRGSITSDEAQAMQEAVQKSRDEWQTDI